MGRFRLVNGIITTGNKTSQNHNSYIVELRRLCFDLYMCYRIILALSVFVYLISFSLTAHPRLEVILTNCTNRVATVVFEPCSLATALLSDWIVYQLITSISFPPSNGQLTTLTVFVVLLWMITIFLLYFILFLGYCQCRLVTLWPVSQDFEGYQLIILWET